jgi:Flp pilus assembly protein TadD
MNVAVRFRFLLLASSCLVTGLGCATIKKLNPIESSTLQARRLTSEAEASIYAQDLEAAETKLVAAIERDPNDNRSRAVFADVLWARGEQLAAVEQMAKAVDLSEGRDPEHIIQLGQMLLTVGNPQAALQRADAALRLDDTSADAWTLKGFALKQTGDSKAALSAFFRSLSIRNDDAQARVEIARIYRQLGQPQRALAILAAPHPENLQVCPQFSEVCYLRGVLLRELDRPSDAVVALQSARKSGCEANDLYLQLAEAQLATGEVLNARATLAEAGKHCGPELRVALSALQEDVDARLPGTAGILR